MSIVPNPNADFSPAGGVYTELKPFRFWCQKVLPLVYDDSLSYYELLCKVVDYLNKTMEDVDNAVTEVTALHTAYDQLEAYVNDYFSTLDVQQEINNKLDAMAEDGSLSTLISPFVAEGLPGLVQEQIPGVVGQQIGGTVAQQIGATVAQQIGGTVAGQISPVVADWLEDNITPTTPAIDASLSVAGAAADAKATGDAVANLKSGFVGIELGTYVGATTPLYVKSGDVISVYVRSNTAEVDMSVAPYVGGDSKITIPQGGYGLYEYTASKSGYIFLSSSTTTLDAVAFFKNANTEMLFESVNEIDGLPLYIEKIGATWESGKYLSNSGAIVEGDPGFLLSDYISCASNTELHIFATIVSSGVAEVGYYDADKTFIGCSVGSNDILVDKTVVTPIETAFIRITWSKTRATLDNFYLTSPSGFVIDKLNKYSDVFTGYNMTGVGEQNFNAESGELLAIYVESNTVQTNLMCGTYTTGDPYITIPVGSGIYYFRPKRTGKLRLQPTATVINAYVYRTSRYDMVNNVYTIGTHGDFNTFTEALTALENDNTEKTIYIEHGVYDIFEEMGGSEYALSIPDDAVNQWRKYNKIVPPNTTIIGLGNVVLRYMPVASDVSTYSARQISPLNVGGNCKIVNIEIECQNCRYAIHDDPGPYSVFDTAIHEYENVRCIKHNDTYGNPQVYGGGAGTNGSVIFNSCKFVSEAQWIWTTHTNVPTSGNGASVIFNNCVFKNIEPSETTRNWELIRFITGDEGGLTPAHNIAKMNNCFVDGKIALAYDGSSTSIAQSWDLTMLGCNDADVTVYSAFAENPYPPEVYNSIS